MDNVLIVDDSDFDRNMIKLAIAGKRDNVSFIELDSGKLLADVLETSDPKIAILDIRMPGMDGFEVLDVIRSNPKYQSLPVLMVSGSEEEEDRLLADASGANGYFVKPPSASAYFSMGRDIYDRFLCCTTGNGMTGCTPSPA